MLSVGTSAIGCQAKPEESTEETTAETTVSTKVTTTSESETETETEETSAPDNVNDGFDPYDGSEIAGIYNKVDIEFQRTDTYLNIRHNITLPTDFEPATVEWVSGNEGIIENDGTIHSKDEYGYIFTYDQVCGDAKVGGRVTITTDLSGHVNGFINGYIRVKVDPVPSIDGDGRCA